MNILIVSAMTPASQTGVTAHYNRLVAGLAGRVDSVTLLTLADAPWIVLKILSVVGKLATAIGGNSPIVYRELANFIALWSAVRFHGNHEFDVVHAQEVNAGAAAAAVLGKRAKVIATCHFNDDPVTEYNEKFTLSPRAQKRLRDWYQYLFSKHDAFITVSDYIQSTSAFLRPADVPCTVIQNGVAFQDTPSKLVSTGLTIINIGTVEERKNQVLLIEAAEELQARGFTDFHIWLMGDGPKRKEWQAIIDAKNLGKFVSFMGFRTDVADYLQRADLYVHTALNESWGYSITEAIASGTPVLSLATGGIPEQFSRHKPGLLSKTTSPAELAMAILPYRDEEKRRQLASEQYTFARERFSLEAMAEKHLAFYKEIVGVQKTDSLRKQAVIS